MTAFAKIPRFLFLVFGTLVAFATLAPTAFAEDKAPLPFVSPLFGDNMVLQRGKPAAVWGWTKPGDTVEVTLGGKSTHAVAQPDGRWLARVEPPPAGGPYVLTVSGSQRVQFHEILVGDVWLCSGQSNMAFALAQAQDGQEEVKAANHPEIRFFRVRDKVAYSPEAVPQGEWKICTPQTVAPEGWGGGLSAVGYFFARRVQEEIGVPVGLVVSSVGGTPAESWTSPEGLSSLKDFDASLEELARLKKAGAPEYGNYINHWYDTYDLGAKGDVWASPGFDDSAWQPVSLPGGFKELGVPEKPAVCYFRKTIVLPDPLPAGAAKVLLGVVERMDTVWINGKKVGASSWVENPRAYPVAPGALKPGANLVVIRVFKTQADGGFRTDPAQLRLTLGDGSSIPLAEGWRGKVSVDARAPHPMPLGFENWPVMPSVLYNGMLSPLVPLSITGALWYQGEQNAGRAEQYRRLLPAMIADWRSRFGQGDFPFYVVSLAAFMAHKQEPGTDDAWADLRGAQDFAAHSVANSGLAVAIDVGDANDIHPKRKKEVGERLALLALARHYGKPVACSGPRFVSAETLPGALRLHFEHLDGGLVAKGEKLEEFAICGDDRKWHWAEARIDGDTVVVSAPEVKTPRFVRYAWQSNPKATLYNGAGLPAIPFRTDEP